MSYYNFNSQTHGTFGPRYSYTSNDLKIGMVNGQYVMNSCSLDYSSNGQYKLYETWKTNDALGERRLVAIPANKELTQQDIDRYEIINYKKDNCHCKNKY